MKTILCTLALLFCITAAPAVADESSVLLDTITRLQGQVSQLDGKIEHKNDVIACERQNRRDLERVLRDGGDVLIVRCAS